MPKKSNKIYVWLDVDRVRNKVVDFEVTTSRSSDAYLPLVERLKEKYHTAIAASDHYSVYNVHHFADKHIMTKAETSLVESKNSLIRHYLARFNRKTMRYSKAIDMIENSILLLFNRKEIQNAIYN